MDREIRLHRALEHENIIALYGAFEDKDHVYLVQEHAMGGCSAARRAGAGPRRGAPAEPRAASQVGTVKERERPAARASDSCCPLCCWLALPAGGDLYEDLKHAGGQYKEQAVARDILPPFLSALHYLHSKRIIHRRGGRAGRVVQPEAGLRPLPALGCSAGLALPRWPLRLPHPWKRRAPHCAAARRDIKPENILLTSERVVKMADFGLSICWAEERPVTRAGTLDYMSPEVLRCPEKSLPEENKVGARGGLGCGAGWVGAGAAWRAAEGQSTAAG